MGDDQLVFIEVEILRRELDGRLLLASHLLDEGFSVFLGARAEVSQLALQHRNAIILLKGLNAKDKALYEEYKKRSHLVLVQDVEGSIYLDDISSEMQSSYPREVAKYADVIFLSGPRLAKAAGSAVDYVTPDRFIVTGDPRFDLLSPHYRNYYSESLRRIRGKFGRYILINTNFGVANPRMGAASFWQYVIANRSFSYEKKRKHILRQVLLEKLLPNFARSVTRLSEEFPHVNWILRPHPSENLGLYQHAIGHRSNVTITNSGSVVDWILGAEGLMHFDCTTAIEAKLAGTPAISFRPIEDRDLMAWLPLKVGVAAKDYSELSQMIRAILDSKINSDDRSCRDDEEIAEFLGDGTHSAARLIASHIRAARDKVSLYQENQEPDRNRWSPTVWLRSNYDDFRNRKRDYKFPSIDASDLLTRCRLLQEIDGLNDEVTAKQISGRLIRFSRRKV